MNQGTWKQQMSMLTISPGVWEDGSDNNTNKTHSRHEENEFDFKLSQRYKRVIQRAVLRKQLKCESWVRTVVESREKDK